MATKKIRTEKILDKTTNTGAILLQPYLGMLLVGALGLILWLIGAKADYTKEIATSLILSTCILSIFIWRASAHRRDLGRMHGLLTTILTGLFLTVFVSVGPVGWLVYSVFLLMVYVLRLILTMLRVEPLSLSAGIC
jgi:hypothetical protein